MANDTFSVSGAVFQKDGDARKPLAGTIVRAVNEAEGITKEQTAGDDGTYSFADLIPGQWQLTARHKGFAEPDPIVLELNADAEGQDFELTRLVSVAGTVYRYGTRERIEGAVVKATSEDGEVEFAVTDDDGDFSLDELKAGTWILVAFHEESRPRQSRPQELTGDVTDFSFKLFRQMGEPDEAAGRRFFAALCAALGVLAIAYVALHARYPTGGPVASAVVHSIGAALKQVESVEKPSESQELKDTLTQIEAGVNTLFSTNPQLFGDEYQQLVRDFVRGAGQRVDGNRKAEARTQLKELRSLISAPPSEEYFWNSGSFRFLEVLLWGMAGVLVNLIITSGNYLRWRRFYREGIVMHVAQLVTVPVLALVFVLLLSLVTLEVTLAGGNDLKVDLSDPRVLAAVSFLIGSQPWNLWDFLQETAGKLTGQGEKEGATS